MISVLRTPEIFSAFSCVQLGAEINVPSEWFSKYETIKQAEYKKIERPDAVYDVVACTHVLQNDLNPEEALKEISRLISADGFMYLSYPSPITREKTEKRDPSKPGAKWIFGRDFEAAISGALGDLYIVAVTGSDEVTNEEAIDYVVTRKPFWVDRIIKLSKSRFIQ